MSLTLFTNAWVLTVDDAMTVHQPGWVHVEKDRIAALGPGPAPQIDGAEIIDCDGDILMPGMVNAHCHMGMSVFRGLAEDVDDRLYRYILPLERKFVTPDLVRTGTSLAALELILGGVTTVADMYYFELEVARILDRSGLRGLAGQTLADFDPPDHTTIDQGFERVDELVDAYAGHPRVTPSIAPHAPYSTGRAVMERVAHWSADHPNVPVQMHLAESTLEVDWARQTHNQSTVAVTRDAGLLKPNLIGAHCLQLDDADIAMMSEHQVCVATNPRSNGKAGRGIAPVEKLRNAGLPVGIGSDGAMSGNTLDLFSQFAPVSMFAKLLGRSRKPLPARDVVRMATLEGARTLSLNLKIGSIEPGKQADLIRIDLSSPRLHPIFDPYSALVFAAMPGDVRDVMVDGRFLLRDRQLQTLDRKKILRDAFQVADEFRAEIHRIDASDVRPLGEPRASS